ARAKWELDNSLDYAMELGRTRLNHGTYARGAQLDLKGCDGGWARTFGAHKAGKLLARRRALARVEAELDSYLQHGVDLVTARELDRQKLVDTINEAAQRLPDKAIFDWVYWLLNAIDPNGELGATEQVLAWLSDKHGVKTEVVRDVLAYHIQVFKEPLRPWAAGRAGYGVWVPPMLPAA